MFQTFLSLGWIWDSQVLDEKNPPRSYTSLDSWLWIGYGEFANPKVAIFLSIVSPNHGVSVLLLLQPMHLGRRLMTLQHLVLRGLGCRGERGGTRGAGVGVGGGTGAFFATWRSTWNFGDKHGGENLGALPYNSWWMVVPPNMVKSRFWPIPHTENGGVFQLFLNFKMERFWKGIELN